MENNKWKTSKWITFTKIHVCPVGPKNGELDATSGRGGIIEDEDACLPAIFSLHVLLLWST